MPSDNEIHFGFINTPYQATTVRRPMASAREESKRKRRRAFRTTRNAEQVSNILEDKYGITEFFWELHEDDIMDLVKEQVADRMQRVMEGTFRTRDRSFANMAKPAFPLIEKMFREFLDRKEMDNMIDGVPTLASIKGTSKWLKGLRPGRPSFVDTGIYRASFRCWGE